MVYVQISLLVPDMQPFMLHSTLLHSFLNTLS